MGKKEQLQVYNINRKGHTKTKRLTLSEFINRSNIIHNHKYEYSKSIYVNVSTKIQIICPNHGIFEQRPADHLKGCGCNKCGRIIAGIAGRLNKTEFINRCNKIHHNKYDYTKTTFNSISENGIIICPIHGEFIQNISNHLYGSGCPLCYKDNRIGINRSNNKEFIEKARIIHNHKYQYYKTSYICSSTPVIITCPKHGDFKQIPNTHLNGSGCPDCGKLNSSNNKKKNYPFIKNATKIHGQLYNYLLVNYVDNITPVEIICQKHGIFKQSPHSHLKGHGCKKCSNNTSNLEYIIERYLIKHKIKFQSHVKFKCNYNNMPNNIEFDFYIPDKNLAIEIDGIYWHSEVSGNKHKNYHLNKTNVAINNKIQLIHIFETEFLNIKRLLYRLNNIFRINHTKIYARNCVIKEISKKEKKSFLNKTHMQGNDASSIHLGLFYNNRLCSVMTFGKRRVSLGSNHITGEYEMYRFSSLGGTNIIGGASKLLKYFIKTYSPRKVWSYCDKRWSIGSLYKTLGFVLDHESSPNYWYFRRTNKLFHRYAFRKHVLSSKLPIFNKNITEWENMKLNGYDRIWDCGTFVFVLEIDIKNLKNNK